MPLQFSPSRRINTLLAWSVGVGFSFYLAFQMLLWFGPSLARLLRSVMRFSEPQPGEISAALRRGLLHGGRHVVDQFTGRATSATDMSRLGYSRHAIGHAPPIRLACRGSLDPVLEVFGVSGVGRVNWRGSSLMLWRPLDCACSEGGLCGGRKALG